MAPGSTAEISGLQGSRDYPFGTLTSVQTISWAILETEGTVFPNADQPRPGK